jgi:hypothetical protein
MARTAARAARAVAVIGHDAEQRLAEGPPVYRCHGNAYDILMQQNRLDPPNRWYP